MTDTHSFQLPFEIECHKQKDQPEFCRVFFHASEIFPKYLHFGMDNVRLANYEQFKEENAGMVVNRNDKLTLYLCNKKTGEDTKLRIDLEPYWPADIGPGEVKVRLGTIDITTAIRELI